MNKKNVKKDTNEIEKIKWHVRTYRDLFLFKILLALAATLISSLRSCHFDSYVYRHPDIILMDIMI